MSFKLFSSVFEHNGEIPGRYTCDGDNISPPLLWQGAPEGTKSYALIIDDPDAPDPKGPTCVWVHWLVFNMPASLSSLPEAQGPQSVIKGISQGQNDWKKLGYGGPCPPVGRHRYFHTLYALDLETLDIHKPNRTELDVAMGAHVIDKAVLMGTYARVIK